MKFTENNKDEEIKDLTPYPVVKAFNDVGWLDQMEDNSRNQYCSTALSSLLCCSQTPRSKSVTHSNHHEHNCNATHRTMEELIQIQ